jgi:hypothetical protein
VSRTLAKKFLSRLVANILRFSWAGRNSDRFVVLSLEEVFSRRVIVRWGDGETSLALGISTRFQKASWALAADLRALAACRSKDVLLCVPLGLLSRDPFSGKSAECIQMWAFTAAFIRFLVRSEEFGDAFMFRKESGLSGRKQLIDSLAACRKIVLVSSRAEDLDALRTEISGVMHVEFLHVSVPSQHAYDVKAALLDQLLAIDGAGVVLLSAGPVGKSLVPDLVRQLPQSVRIIDTGNFFDHLRDHSVRSAVK